MPLEPSARPERFNEVITGRLGATSAQQQTGLADQGFWPSGSLGHGQYARRVGIVQEHAVVPAKAGTHNHRHSFEQKPLAIVPKCRAAAYGSPLSRGRRELGHLSTSAMPFQVHWSISEFPKFSLTAW